MSDSNLVQYRNLTRNYSRRTAAISKITIHHAAGVGTAQSVTDSFIPASRKASANYVIGNDGKIGQSVLECHRAWTSNSFWNDNQAITIEVSNSQKGGDWPISDAAYAAMINLCVDICQRNKINSVCYDGTKNGVLTEHRMFAATQCPGEYIHNLLKSGKIATDINARLDSGLVYGDGFMAYGLDFEPVFNPDYYIKRYPDLSAAGLKTSTQLFTHFCQFGMSEARQGCVSFDPVKYRKANKDLNDVLGDDWEAYYKHYCMCGKEEIEQGLRKSLT